MGEVFLLRSPGGYIRSVYVVSNGMNYWWFVLRSILLISTLINMLLCGDDDDDGDDVRLDLHSYVSV